MIKRTPQEIADFFGCYVARDKEGEGYFLFDGKPEIDEDEEQWFLPLKSSVGVLNEEYINKQPDRDWTHLYEPHPDNKSEANLADSPKANNKEYIMVVSADVAELSANVSEMMNKGWIPIEDPGYAKLIDESACWYQAMVRGV